MHIATPESRAATLFLDAFSSVFENDPRLTISLNKDCGSRIAVTGELTNDGLMRFDAHEVSTLLVWLTRAVVYDTDAVVTVTADLDEDGEYARLWAWQIADGRPLDTPAAAELSAEDVEVRYAADPYTTLADRGVDIIGLSAAALTEDVKGAIVRHSQNGRTATGRTIALRAPGAITVHITAAGVGPARQELRAIEFEDFDVEFRTRGGHLIGHVMIDDADSAELVTVDGVPADELGEADTK
ncbi:hypothetical protein ACWCQP_36845 [Streptomyces chartreusis]